MGVKLRAMSGAQRERLDLWLLIIRGVWVVLVAGLALILVRVATANFTLVHRLCTSSGNSCVGATLTRQQLHGLEAIGFSPTTYAAYFDTLNVLFVAVFTVVAAAIIFRRGRDRMAILTAFILVLFGATIFPDAAGTVKAVDPSWWLPVAVLSCLGTTGMLLFFFLFPDGHFVPRWTILPATVWAADQSLRYLAPSSPVAGHTGAMSILPWIFVFGSAIYAQIYRYRRVSTPSQRQQTKWVVLCLAVGLSVFVGLIASLAVDPVIANNGAGFLLFGTAIYVVISLIPLSLGFAILRYRLWDVDVLINRTLVYGALTVSVVLLYVGGVIALQALFRALTGQGSDVAVVISTLAIAALFQPLRRRIQSTIDQRFYRRKYDAARTLTTFQSQLRDEVDLEQLSHDLIRVVQETMQPSHASLWLRPERERTS